LKRNDTNICYSHQGLKKNEEIKLILTFKNSSLCYILETKENVDENNVILDIPISLTQYIQVRYIFVNVQIFGYRLGKTESKDDSVRFRLYKVQNPI